MWHKNALSLIQACESDETRAGVTWGPKSQVTRAHYMRSRPLRAWKLGLTASHLVPNTTWTSTWQTSFVEARSFCSIQLSTQVLRFSARNTQESTLMIVDHILTLSWGSKAETVPPCWDLLTWVGLGAWDPVWTNPRILIPQLHGSHKLGHTLPVCQ